jgi:hypothetical protein
MPKHIISTKRDQRFTVGWDDGRPLKTVTGLEMVRKTFPEIFRERDTLRKMRARVDTVNSEGNYHEFVFRPAWEDEKDAQ